MLLEVPADWVHPVQGDQPDLYKRETTRVVYGHTGMVLCGSEMPQIELRRDTGLTQRGHQSYSFLYVLPCPDEAENIFSDPMLLSLQWETQLHASGEKELLPVLPGPLGDFNSKILNKLDKSVTAKHGLGFSLQAMISCVGSTPMSCWRKHC